MSKTIVAVFESIDYAENAARKIKENGMRTEDISIVARDNQNQNDTTRYTLTDQFEGDTTATMQARNDNISDGVVAGGIIGGLAGLLIGAGIMAIPGLGIIAAAGPIAGLIGGAATGGIVGGLVDLGIPEEKSKEYEQEIKTGSIIFSMKAQDQKVDEIKSVLRNSGAQSIEAY